MNEVSIDALPNVDHLDLRQWVPLAEARLIYEARHGGERARAELEDGFDGDPDRLIQTIWDLAWMERREQQDPCWCWKWRAS